MFRYTYPIFTSVKSLLKNLLNLNLNPMKAKLRFIFMLFVMLFISEFCHAQEYKEITYEIVSDKISEREIVIQENEKIKLTIIGDAAEDFDLTVDDGKALPSYVWGKTDLGIKGLESGTPTKKEFYPKKLEGGKIFTFKIKQKNSTGNETKVMEEFTVEVHEIIYIELSAGIIGTYLDNPQFDLEPAGTDANNKELVLLTNRPSTSNLKSVIGVIIHPLGYSPRDFHWLKNLGMFLGISLNNNIFENVYLGGSFGMRGIHLIAGAHYGKITTLKDFYHFNTTYKLSEVSVEKVTTGQMDWGTFVGLSLDKTFFKTITGN